MEGAEPTVSILSTATHATSIRVLIFSPNNLSNVEHATPMKKLRIRMMSTDTFADLCHNVVEHFKARGDPSFSAGGIFDGEGNELSSADPIDFLEEDEVVRIVRAPTTDRIPLRESATSFRRETSIAGSIAPGKSAAPSRTARASTVVPGSPVALPDSQIPSLVRSALALSFFASIEIWADSLIAQLPSGHASPLVRDTHPARLAERAPQSTAAPPTPRSPSSVPVRRIHSNGVLHAGVPAEQRELDDHQHKPLEESMQPGGGRAKADAYGSTNPPTPASSDKQPLPPIVRTNVQQRTHSLILATPSKTSKPEPEESLDRPLASLKRLRTPPRPGFRDIQPASSRADPYEVPSSDSDNGLPRKAPISKVVRCGGHQAVDCSWRASLIDLARTTRTTQALCASSTQDGPTSAQVASSFSKSPARSTSPGTRSSDDTVIPFSSPPIPASSAATLVAAAPSAVRQAAMHRSSITLGDTPGSAKKKVAFGSRAYASTPTRDRSTSRNKGNDKELPVTVNDQLRIIRVIEISSNEGDSTDSHSDVRGDIKPSSHPAAVQVKLETKSSPSNSLSAFGLSQTTSVAAAKSGEGWPRNPRSTPSADHVVQELLNTRLSGKPSASDRPTTIKPTQNESEDDSDIPEVVDLTRDDSVDDSDTPGVIDLTQDDSDDDRNVPQSIIPVPGARLPKKATPAAANYGIFNKQPVVIQPFVNSKREVLASEEIKKEELLKLANLAAIPKQSQVERGTPRIGRSFMRSAGAGYGSGERIFDDIPHHPHDVVDDMSSAKVGKVTAAESTRRVLRVARTRASIEQEEYERQKRAKEIQSAQARQNSQQMRAMYEDPSKGRESPELTSTYRSPWPKSSRECSKSFASNHRDKTVDLKPTLVMPESSQNADLQDSGPPSHQRPNEYERTPATLHKVILDGQRAEGSGQSFPSLTPATKENNMIDHNSSEACAASKKLGQNLREISACKTEGIERKKREAEEARRQSSQPASAYMGKSSIVVEIRAKRSRAAKMMPPVKCKQLTSCRTLFGV